jgi:aldose 1-epimerase
MRGFRAGFIGLVLSACSGAKAPPPAELPKQPGPSALAPTAAAPAATAPAPNAPPVPKASVSEAAYGKLGDLNVRLFTLTNQHGLVVKITDYGATVTECHVPDKHGKLADVVLGFETLEGYTQPKNPFFGAIVGRIANRIRNAKFELEGKRYELAANDKPHSLHGGKKGWDKVLWEAKPSESPEGAALELSYVSKDGEEGYPGTVSARVVYTLTQNNELHVQMSATTDRTTIINLAHHSYWNLAGFDSGTIADHEVQLFADRYTPGDPMVPTGELKAVSGTPFDFTTPKPIGRDLLKVPSKPIGYDHNYVVNGDPRALRPVARVKDPKSGRVLTLEADQPGVQFYTGNFLDGTVSGKGATYAQYAGFCLETQAFPNAINVPAWRDQVILKPGTDYTHTMIHRFTAE